MIKKKFLFLKQKNEKQNLNKKNLSSFFILGKNQTIVLKKKIGINRGHFLGGLREDLFLELQTSIKKDERFVNQLKIKEAALELLKKRLNFKHNRFVKNLPLRGQRTRTNAKTRKKRNII